MFGMLRRSQKTKNAQPSPYATGADFCRIFKEDMNRLYLLSFLLTGDHASAEKCFVRGFDDSAKGNPVFKEWAESWAGRTIIRTAIQMIRPLPGDGSPSSSVSEPSGGDAAGESAEIAQVVELPAFERFVFVMSVLERYSDQECSLLLGCRRSQVSEARTLALSLLGRSAELLRKLVSISSARKGYATTLDLESSSRIYAT